MMKSVQVLIDWVPEKLKHLPASGVYSTVARFTEDADWPANAWSVVIEFNPSENKSFQATARFLIPTAPSDRLKAGCVFQLYEGAKKMAQVTVL